nr:Condensin complex subunit [Polyrhizophydium stewartii]
MKRHFCHHVGQVSDIPTRHDVPELAQRHPRPHRHPRPTRAAASNHTDRQSPPYPNPEPTMGFLLHEELLAFQDPAQPIDNQLPVADLTRDETEQHLDDLVTLLQEDPNAILNPRTFDSCKSFIKYFDSLTLGETIKAVKLDLEENAQYNFETDRLLAEMYAFVAACLIERAEARWREMRAEAPKVAKLPRALKPKTKSSKSKTSASGDDDSWDWLSHLERTLVQLEHLVGLQLDRLILASSERDVVMNMVCKSVSLVLENPDVIKRESIKSPLMDILCVVATRYNAPGKPGGVQSRIDDYLREDNLADFVAELLNAMIANQENTAFVEAVLNSIAERAFTDKDLKTAKTISRVLVRFSEMRPKEMIKCMAQLQVQFDSESYTIRSAMIEVIGNLIHLHLVNDPSEAAAKSLHSYYAILIERFHDVNQYVRTKVLQVVTKLSERRQDAPAVTDIPLETRHGLVTLAIGRLRDKASIVRKNAIKLLARFIETSPFIAIEEDQGRLSRRYFETHKADLMRVIEEKYPKEVMQMLISGTSGAAAAAAAEENDMLVESQASSAGAGADADAGADANKAPIELNDVELQRLRVLVKYYDDGIQFIGQIEHAVPVLCDLLSSSIRSEVVEVMRFFVVAFRFEMEASWEGVRRMVHKIWEKDTADNEAGSIREHVIRCYESLFLDPPEGPRAVEEVIAENLVALTQRMNLAELTSLEQLVSLMAQTDRLNMKATDVLWSIFCSRRPDMPAIKRQGAVMVLGMIGKACKDVLLQNLERLVRHGFGGVGGVSLGLARHTCLTLQHAAADKREKGKLARAFTRLQPDHALFERLGSLVLAPSATLEWFPFCEQAINTVYALAEHPDMIAGQLVKQMAQRTFSKHDNRAAAAAAAAAAEAAKGAVGADAAGDPVDALSEDMSRRLVIGGGGSSGGVGDERDGAAQREGEADAPAMATASNAFALAQLCFLVGHVAIKQIVHLEAIEAEWKRQRHAQESGGVPQTPGARTPARKTGGAGGAGGESLEQVTGTVEDEFADNVVFVRERELLFGERSLLGVFGPMLTQICLHNRAYHVSLILRSGGAGLRVW